MESDRLVCRHCGEELEAGWSECPACLERVLDPGSCPGCGRLVKPTWKMCPECKTALSSGTTARFESLPSLLAIPLADYFEESSEREPKLKLWHACDAIELLLRLLVMIGLADLRRQGELPPELVNELRDRVEKPTLGRWRGMAEALAKRLDAETATIPELADFVLGELVPFLTGSTNPPTPESSFSALRNQLAHGGGVTQEYARRLLSHWAAPFEAVITKAGFLSRATLVVRMADGTFGALRGKASQPTPLPAEMQGIVRKCPDEASTLLVDGTRVCVLWPLALWSKPRRLGGSTMEGMEVPQVYARSEDTGLQFTPLGADWTCQSEADHQTWEAFRRLFQLDQKCDKAAAKVFSVAGFEREIRKDADEVVGRAEETRALERLLRDTPDGHIWVSGQAGIGKSHTLARVVSDLLDNPPSATRLLPFRFKIGDERCSRDTFLRFAIERLDNWQGLEVDGESPDIDKQKPFDRLRALLERVADGHRVVFVLDGLDEIAARDKRFAADVPLTLILSKVLWVCAGRPESGLPEAFRRVQALEPWPKGLPRMTEADIHEMLLERLGKLRARLIRGDRDEGDRVVNSFVKRVAGYADGLPIYVRYVVNDALGGKISPEASAELPPSLAEYHEKILERCEIGDLKQVLSPLVGTLAVAREPLGVGALADLLARRHVVSPGEDGMSLVRQALSALGATIRCLPTPEDDDGYALFHLSFRQHVLSSQRTQTVVATAHQALADAAIVPDKAGRTAIRHSEDEGPAAAPYLFRCGVAHLVECAHREQAEQLLSTFDYLMRRLQWLGKPSDVRAISADWRLLRGFGLAGDVALWEEFWRTSDILIARGDGDWPSWRVLLQLARDHALESPLTAAATDWLRRFGGCDPRAHLALPCIPIKMLKDPCLAILEGHRSFVVSIALARDTPVAVSGGGSDYHPDSTVCVWDLERLERRHQLNGHEDLVTGVSVAANGARAASVSRDGHLLVWDLDDGQLLCDLGPVVGSLSAVLMSDDGTLALTGGSDGTVRRWQFGDNPGGDVAVDTRTSVNALTVDSTWRLLILGCGDGSVRAWDLDACSWVWNCHGHEGGVLAVAVTPDGSRAVSGGLDGQVLLWDIPGGASIQSWSCSPDSVAAVALSGDGRRVFAGFAAGPNRTDPLERSIRVWDTENGDLLARFSGHSDSVRAIGLTSDGSRAMSCSHDGSARLWDVRLIGESLHTDSELSFISTLQCTADGGRGILVSDDGKLRIWDLPNQDYVHIIESHTEVTDAALSPDETRVVAVSGSSLLEIWELASGQLTATCQSSGATIDKVCSTPDGRFAFTTPWSPFLQTGEEKDTFLRRWCLRTGIATPLRECVSGDNSTRNLVCTPDGTLLVTAESARSVALWDARNLRKLRHLGSVPDDVSGLAVSPNGRLIAVGDEGSGEVSLWGLSSGECVQQIPAHKRHCYTRALCFSGDGHYLYTGSDDGSLRIWNVDDGTLVAAEYFRAWVTAISPLGAKYDVWVGLSNGEHFVVELENVGGPSSVWVTATRLFRATTSGDQTSISPTGWDENITVRCPGCGILNGQGKDLLRAIQAAAKICRGQTHPCIDISEGLWSSSDLVTPCPSCGLSLRLNPYVVDNRSVDT